MVRKLFIFIVLTTVLFANLDDKIRNYLSPEQYAKQVNLIKILFKNSDDFYRKSDGNVDSLKVIEVLKENGLFKMFYKQPVSLNIDFITDKNPLIFIKVVSESLDAIGYNYFLTSQAQKSDGKFLWSINLRTEHLVNPILFAKELEKRGCTIDDISKKKENYWVYKINSDNAKLDAKVVDIDTTVKFKKPISDYLIQNNGASSIKIRTSFSDHWYPKIIFLDRGLHVISQKIINERTYVVEVKIPINSKYIKIGDLYTLDNIKHGLSIYLKSAN
ncbi:MAG: hypothetical protein GXP61_02085 [Epsilonproteobacteria bacterium]|nr:hypothetical protein [Campylobacterota bacterium]